MELFFALNFAQSTKLFYPVLFLVLQTFGNTMTRLNKDLFKVFIPQDISQHRLALAITLVSIIYMLCMPYSSEWMIYQRDAVDQGQWWRLFSANLAHSNWNHWGLNILGLWLIDLFFQPVLSQATRNSLLLFAMIFNVLMLHFWVDIDSYVGLSGALHGYVIGAAIITWRADPFIHLSMAVVIIAKLIIESIWHINQSTEQLIGTNVVEESHAFGGVAAIIFVLIYVVLIKTQIIKTTEPN